MADLTSGWTCRSCGASAPASAIWCPRCGADPLDLDEPPAPPPPTAHRPEPERVAAPDAAGRRAARAVLLVLPNHITVPLPDGEPVQLGRETQHEAIDDALQHFLDVSRHHAVVELRGDTVHVSRDRAPDDSVIAVESSRIGSSGTAEVGDRIRLGVHCWLRVVEA